MNSGMQNQEAELAVIGSALLDADAALLALELLPDASLFYYSGNRIIWHCVLSLSKMNAAIDPITVIDRVRTAGKLEEIGGAEAIISAMEILPTFQNVRHYAGIVLECAKKRRLHIAGHRIAEAAADNENTAESAMKAAEQALDTVNAGINQGGFVKVSAGLDEFYETVTNYNEATLLKTGIRTVDGILQGFSPGDLVILAARPGMGKTALALQIALNFLDATKTKKPAGKVGICSLEMPLDQLRMRLLSNIAGVHATKIRTGKLVQEDYNRIITALNEMQNLNLLIDDSSYISMGELKSRVTRLKRAEGIDLLIIDYLQLMADSEGGGGYSNRNAEISDITRQLKAMAKTLQIPIIALSQLSRECEKRQDKRPLLSDLRDSGAIEQDADIVMFIYRPGYYNATGEKSKFEHKKEEEANKEAEVIISKNRNGGNGTAKILFFPEFLRFVDGYFD